MERSTIDLWVGIFVAPASARCSFLALKVGNLATSAWANELSRWTRSSTTSAG